MRYVVQYYNATFDTFFDVCVNNTTSTDAKLFVRQLLRERANRNKVYRVIPREIA